MTHLLKKTDADAIEEFGTDESGIYQAEGVEAVWYPQTEAEVAEVLAEANRSGRLVTTSGGGTGITGGRVALHGGWVLATQDLAEPMARDCSRITQNQFGREYCIYLDEENAEVYAPAGIPLELLGEMLPEPLLYPPDPTEKSAFLGSTIVTNASGARTFHYGATRDWVLGLRVVLPTGDIVAVSRGEVKTADGILRFTAESGTEYTVPVPTYPMPEMKNAAGLYSAPDMDLVDLFIGSEGLLGVISEARLRLAQRPEEMIGQIAFFASEDDAMGFVNDLREAAKSGAMTVLSIEYFDAGSLDFMEYEPVEGKGYCAVYCEAAGSLDELDPLLEALEAHNCVEDWFAETPRDEQEQKEFRHSLPDAVNSYLRRHGSQKLGTDMVVPPDKFPEMLANYRAAGEAFSEQFPRDGKHVVIFGHIGNYHVHVNFITHSEAELSFCKGLYGKLAQQAVALGGTVSGEHGVGKKTILVNGRSIPYLEVMIGAGGLMQIARAKKAVDPNLILDLGNMVPREYFANV